MALGAWLHDAGVRFRVWAPEHERLEVVWTSQGATASQPLNKDPDGTFSGWVPGIGPGTRYQYRLNGGVLRPDPASRFQPEGVHGPSEVIDPHRFAWTDRQWSGV